MTKEQISQEQRIARGENSEENVITALSSVPEITGIRRSVPFDKRDLRGVDLTVWLEPQGKTGFTRVDVQVKSSNNKIRKFKESFRRRAKAAGDERPLEELLDKKRLIILNGQLPPEEIIEGFNNQLQRMKDRRR